FGCVRCQPADPFNRLSEVLKARVQSGEPCRCPQHPLQAATVMCPNAECNRPLQAAWLLGLVAFSNGGKTMLCSAINEQLSTHVRARTGVDSAALYDQAAFPSIGKDGELPEKSDIGRHQTVRFTLTRAGWDQQRRIDVVDMSGEYYANLLAEAKN